MKILLIGKITYDNYNSHQGEQTGGNIFNIAKHLSTLLPKDQLSVVYPSGNDEVGSIVDEQTKNLGIKNFKISVNKTPITKYEDNQPKIFEEPSLRKEFSVDKISKFKDELTNFDIIVADLNFSDILKYIITLNPNAKIFIDMTSIELAKIVDSLSLDNVTYKFNRQQAESIIEKSIFDFSDCLDAKEILAKRNIKKAFITLDKDGCFFYDEFNQGLIKAEVVTNKKYYNAGSAFLAGAIHAYTLSSDIEFMAKQGIESSARQIIKEIEANFAKSSKLDR